MGKKKNNKKGNDYWDEDFEQDATVLAPPANDDAVDAENFNKDEEGNELGGLMAQMASAAKNKKNKKGKNKGAQKSSKEENDNVDSLTAPADESDEEFKPANKNGNKKHKPVASFDLLSQLDDAGNNDVDENEADSTEEKENEAKPSAKQEAPSAKKTNGKSTPTPDDFEDAETSSTTGEVKIKSKKEKEREKKERQKAQKKAAAAAKKAQQAKEDAEVFGETSSKPESKSTPTKPAKQPTPSQSPLKDAEENDDEEDEGEGEGAGAASKNKKKKKKKKKGEAAEEAPAAAPVKKRKGAPVAALQAMIAQQRAAEEEARRKEEEARKIEEEERRRIEEEERKAEEARQRKKEKEKAKREQLKKEGKLLTKAQKEAQQRAKLKLQQLLDQGVKVAALEQSQAGSPEKKKRPIYNNRKKRGAQQQQSQAPPKTEEKQPKAEPKQEEVESTKESWEESETEEQAENAEEDVKESWEESTEDEADKEAADAKESWEDESESEKEEKPQKSKSPAKSVSKKQEESESEESSEEESDEDETDSSDEDSEEEELSTTAKMEKARKDAAADRRKKRHQEALAARSVEDLRSPICCILGHVDTGKTKLLDKIRQTNVQEGEAGGITQQIGATYFPVDAIKSKTELLDNMRNESSGVMFDYKVPGLLIIDTPGHESFTNLRTRGSSLCNIAILVVDIMHGLEQQTLESLNLLRQRKTPFIVALNKIDRIYDWQAHPNEPVELTLSKQKPHVIKEFQQRVSQTITLFAEQGLNATLYYENKNFAKYVSLVPTSAITGEGIPDMLRLLVELTQSRMSDKLMYLSELEATVLEVKVVEGLGTTIDVILVNGWLRESDRIVTCGLDGPIVTNVRALLTPQPMKELRIKSAYVHHKAIKAAMGVKICANGLEKAIAGSRLMVVGPDDDEEELKEEVMSDLKDLLSFIDKSGKGVCVQASTLGSLEALLQFLKDSKIPVSGINIGPVHKKDVMRASVMLDSAKEFAVMLCFDVKVDKDASDLAEELGVRVFKADIIYHLFDQFTAYHNDMLEQKRKDAAPVAVFPCVLKIIPGAVFNKRDPIVLGVDVVEGILRVGTPLCVLGPDKKPISIGKVASMEINHRSVESVKRGQAGAGVAIKIECPVYENPKMYGRHFTDKDELISKVCAQKQSLLDSCLVFDSLILT
ncbi:hypothetical protein BKA69DRAFT_1089282 [Paraphysoderma sedebokerense]|nr:hypothetical protein BKA69DRAFT_1089282 [Paraphysoderma sedebokerense]